MFSVQFTMLNDLVYFTVNIVFCTVDIVNCPAFLAGKPCGRDGLLILCLHPHHGAELPQSGHETQEYKYKFRLANTGHETQDYQHNFILANTGQYWPQNKILKA